MTQNQCGQFFQANNFCVWNLCIVAARGSYQDDIQMSFLAMLGQKRQKIGCSSSQEHWADIYRTCQLLREILGDILKQILCLGSNSGVWPGNIPSKVQGRLLFSISLLSSPQIQEEQPELEEVKLPLPQSWELQTRGPNPLYREKQWENFYNIEHWSINMLLKVWVAVCMKIAWILPVFRYHKIWRWSHKVAAAF